MARIFIEGGEHGNVNTLLFTSQSGLQVNAGAMAGFSGAYDMKFNSGYAYGDITLDQTYSELYVALKIYPVVRSGNGPGTICFYDSALTAIGSLFFYYDGSTYFYVRLMLGAQNSGTILETGATEITPGTVHLLQVRYKPLNTGGIFQVKLDNQTPLECDYSGDTTAGLENIKKVRIGANGVDNYQSEFDDVVIDDSEWPGNTRIQKLQISGAGTTGEWDASAGDPYACVDEIPYSDSDYISTNVPGELATFACADMTGNVGKVKALQLQGRLLYEGDPAPNKQKLAIRVNGSNYYSGRFTPGIAVANFRKIWAVNPDDSEAWQEADINAIEIGTRAIQMTSTSSTTTTTTTT